jgi:uncharacterized protein YmfQ (DUF2313 family)
MLPDWERACGLPESVRAVAPETLSGRRMAVVAKLLARIGQRPADYEVLAEARGYPGARVEEFRPFRVGMSLCRRRADQWRLGPLPGSCGPPTRPYGIFSVGASCAGEPLATWGDATARMRDPAPRPVPYHRAFRLRRGGL